MPRKKRQKESFPQRLASIRKMKGLTQVEVSRLTGISTRMICHYETKIRNPAPETVLRLAKALNISIDELMGYQPIKREESTGSRKLARKMKVFDKLPEKEQKKIIDYINDLAAKYNTTNNH